MSKFYSKSNVNHIEVDGRHFINDLRQKNYTIQLYDYPMGHMVPYHCHSQQEILIILSGMLRLIIEEDIIDLETDEVIKIEPWAVHLMCCPKKDGSLFLRCYPKRKFPRQS